MRLRKIIPIKVAIDSFRRGFTCRLIDDCLKIVNLCCAMTEDFHLSPFLDFCFSSELILALVTMLIPRTTTMA